MNKYTIKKHILTPLLVVATFLGMSGVNTASAADDRNLVSDMALTFSKYQVYPSLEALDWAEANTTGRAYADPYRYSVPKKNRFIASVEGSRVGFRNNIAFYRSVVESVNYIDEDTLSVVVKRIVSPVSVGDKVFYTYLEKTWFKRESDWKLADYYTLFTNYKRNGIVQPCSKAAINSPFNFLGNKFKYDSQGTQFPR